MTYNDGLRYAYAVSVCVASAGRASEYEIGPIAGCFRSRQRASFEHVRECHSLPYLSLLNMISIITPSPLEIFEEGGLHLQFLVPNPHDVWRYRLGKARL